MEWEDEPKPRIQISVLPNVGRELNSPPMPWWQGWQGLLFTLEPLAAPNRAPRLYMVHFVEGVPEWNRLGIGQEGTQPDEITVSLL